MCVCRYVLAISILNVPLLTAVAFLSCAEAEAVAAAAPPTDGLVLNYVKPRVYIYLVHDVTVHKHGAIPEQIAAGLRFHQQTGAYWSACLVCLAKSRRVLRVQEHVHP